MTSAIPLTLTVDSSTVASTVVMPASKVTNVPIVTSLPQLTTMTVPTTAATAIPSASVTVTQMTSMFPSSSSIPTTLTSTSTSATTTTIKSTFNNNNHPTINQLLLSQCNAAHPENCPDLSLSTAFAASSSSSTPSSTSSHGTSPLTTTPFQTTQTQTQISNSAPNFSDPPKTFLPDRLAKIDLIIIVVYLCLIISTSISTYLRVRHKKKRNKKKLQHSTTSTPTITMPHMNWFTVGASIFASNMGSDLFIGLSGSAASNGLAVAAFEVSALIVMQLATWLFLPVLIVSKISTLPEYMSKRFGGVRIRTYLALLAILLYIFTKVSVNLYSGGIFIQQAIGMNLYASAMFVLAITALMTMTGGAKGTMLIDQAQAWIMAIGASIVAKMALDAIDGWSGLQRRYALAVPRQVPANLTHCAQTNPRAFQILRPLDDKDMPWLGFILGQLPGGIWYWCADQSVMQRFLSARSLAHAQGASIFAGYLKVLPLIFMVIPGMISRALFPDEVACIDAAECKKYCQSTVSCSNTAYPRLVLQLLPMGIRGMMVATMVAALISDLCNVFNSASALFTCDVWPLIRKNASRKELSLVGRVFVLFLVVASIMWIPVIQEMQGGQLFIYIQAVSCLFAPPITAVYMCAVLWKRTNECAAFWSLMIGFALGVYRMILSFLYKEPSCGQTFDDRPLILRIQYMYFALILFIVSLTSIYIISKLTKAPPAFRLVRTTYWTRFDTSMRDDDYRTGIELSKTISSCSSAEKSTLRSKNNNNKANKTTSRRVATKSTLIHNSNKDDDFYGDELSSGALQVEQSERLVARSPISDTSGNNSGRASAMSQTQDSLVMNMDDAIKRADLVDKAKVVSSSNAATTGKRQPLQHQSSLSASAAEAGKFLANKLASSLQKADVEKQLKGAKDIVKAAASHLHGGATRIRFTNLNGDDDDDDDDDYDDNDNKFRIAAMNTNDDDEYDEDDDYGEEEDETTTDALDDDAVSSDATATRASGCGFLGKKASKFGYKKTANDEDDDDDDENDDDGDDEDDEDDDGDDEKLDLSRAASFKGTPKKNVNSQSVASSWSNNKKQNTRKNANQQVISNTVLVKQQQKQLLLKQQKAKKRQRQVRRASVGKNYDQEAANFACIDSSIKLLMKTKLEDTILKISVVAICLVSIGIMALFSIPPAMPSNDVVELLVNN